MMGLAGVILTLGRSLGNFRAFTVLEHTIKGSLSFCGVRYFQWDDGSIEMEQNSYIQKISTRRDPTKSPDGAKKRPYLPRRHRCSGKICGSIQYASVHTRPDLSAKVGELQAAIPHGRIEHLIQANRVLYEAKTKPVFHHDCTNS